MNRNKKKCLIAATVLLLVFALGVTIGSCRRSTSRKPSAPTVILPQGGVAEPPAESSATQENSQEETSQPTETQREEPLQPSVPEEETPSGKPDEHPVAPQLWWIENLRVPEYDGVHAYVEINGGMPFFDTAAVKPEAYECYYDLDALGRCTLADAVCGRELMPTEPRGSISAVKPTGWHSDRYPQSLVDGESLYNRCHLIAFGLTGETANPYNLVTGTRYFNTKGINAFENMVMDYIRETGNHVRYRVTPVWTGDNLICDGQVTEAWSIEDAGEGICFCIYSYNVQPGIVIDYATGDNHLAGEETAVIPEEEKSMGLLETDFEGTFVLNLKKLRIHRPDCAGVTNMSKKNRGDYTGSYNALIARGYEPCPSCKPELMPAA